MKLTFRPFLILLLIGILISCQHKKNKEDKMIFRYNESSGIQSLDPAYSSGQSTIWPCNLLYNGLVDLDDSLNIVPCIAKRWTVSEDGKVYTFIIRDDVYFQNTQHFPFKEKRKVTGAGFCLQLQPYFRRRCSLARRLDLSES